MTKPDFTGHWQFDSGASELQIETPEAIELSIRHDEPHFRLERTLVIAGHGDTFSIDLEVGKDHPPFSRGSAILHPSLHWDEDQLIFLTRIDAGADESTNLVRYQLSGDRTALVAEESFRSSGRDYDNRWVFHKKRETRVIPGPDEQG